MQNLPPVKWASQHPRLAAWLVLSIGMIGLITFEGRDVGLLARQWAALWIACVVVAGLCIWIISWEDESEEALEASTSDSVTEEATA